MRRHSWSECVPAAALPLLLQWIDPLDVDIMVKGARRTKNGDFRAPQRGEVPRITVNEDLGPYRFLLTLVHELAHFRNWREHGGRVKAHGVEWKRHFASLLRELTTVQELPRLYRAALMAHARNPKSSVSADPQLQRVLCQFDPERDPSVRLVGDLPIGAHFTVADRRFKKLSAQRTRCICLDLDSGQRYHVYKNAQAHVLNL